MYTHNNEHRMINLMNPNTKATPSVQIHTRLKRTTAIFARRKPPRAFPKKFRTLKIRFDLFVCAFASDTTTSHRRNPSHCDTFLSHTAMMKSAILAKVVEKRDKSRREHRPKEWQVFAKKYIYILIYICMHVYKYISLRGAVNRRRGDATRRASSAEIKFRAVYKKESRCRHRKMHDA